MQNADQELAIMDLTSSPAPVTRNEELKSHEVELETSESCLLKTTFWE